MSVIMFRQTLSQTLKGGKRNEKNLSAQEAPSHEGTRFPQENVHSKRPQGTCPSQSEGKKASYSLIYN